MGFLLTASVLFLFTLLVPGFASANGGPTKDELARRQRSIEQLERSRVKLEGRVEALKQEQSALEGANAPLRERNQLAQQLLTAETQLKINTEELTIANDRHGESAKKAAIKIKQLEKELQEVLKGMNAANKAARDLTGELAGMMGMSDQLGKGIIGSFVQARQEGASFTQIMTALAAEMKQTFSVGNILLNVYAKIKEATIGMALAQDKAISSFLRATGATQGYSDIMEQMFLNARQVGVSFEEASNALSSLYSGMASFSTLNNTTQEQLGRQVALMGEIGISVDSAARSFNTLVQAMGRTPQEAARINLEMVEMAERIGIPPARMIEEFAQASSQLAQYGDRMTQVFYRLEAAAKATGVAVNSLIGYTSQYDTFYGAAEAVGKLNAILGGPYLNAMQMVNATESERIRLTLQMLETSGRSWGSMDRYTRLAVAHAAGIQDMNTAASIFNQTTSQFDAAQRRIAATAASEEELARRAQEAQTVFEMLKNTMYSFAVMIRPLVEDFRDVVEWVTKVADSLSENKLMGVIARGVVLFGVASSALAILGGALSSLLSPLGLVTAAVAGLSMLFTRGHSPTFPEYIGIAAINMGRFAGSAREALSPVRELNREMSRTTESMMGTVSTLSTDIMPSIKALGQEMVTASRTMTNSIAGIMPPIKSLNREIATTASNLAGSVSGMMPPIQSLNREIAMTASNVVNSVAGILPAVRGLNSEVASTATAMANSVAGVLPSVRTLSREMSATAAAMQTSVTASNNARLRTTAGGLSVVRVEESAELKNVFYKLLQSNERYAARLEAAATSETVLKMNGREFGRAAKTAVNREMRLAGKQY